MKCVQEIKLAYYGERLFNYLRDSAIASITLSIRRCTFNDSHYHDSSYHGNYYRVNVAQLYNSLIHRLYFSVR